MKRTHFAAVLLLCSVFALPLAAQSGMSSRLRSYIHSMEEADLPRIIEEHLVLTYESAGPVRYVAAAFGHEDFSSLHIYRINQNGVFVLAYPLPRDTRELKYRIIVDGLWMSDPRNPRAEADPRGIPISVVTLPSRPVERGETPILHPDGTTEFVYYGRRESRVRVAGDFNRWSPFAHALEEVSPGEYRLRLRLYEGFHRYLFYVDGSRISDPRNPRTAYDVLGNQVSAVTVPSSLDGGARLADQR